MKKSIYLLILPLVVVSALVFANCESKNETKPSPKASEKPKVIAYHKPDPDARKKWEASPDGVKYKAWEASPEGKKVQASHDKIKKYLKDSINMDAVVTSVTFQRDNAKSGPKWLIVRIDGDEYMMQFTPKEFEQLKSLKVNDKIIVRSHSAGLSNSHPFLIVSADYIEHDGKVLFKRDLSKNKGC